MQDPARSRHPAPTHPSQGRDRPRDWLTERNRWCWPGMSQDQKQHTLIPREARSEGSESTHHITLTEKNTGEKQEGADERPCSSLVLCRSQLLLSRGSADRLSRGSGFPPPP